MAGFVTGTDRRGLKSRRMRTSPATWVLFALILVAIAGMGERVAKLVSS